MKKIKSNIGKVNLDIKRLYLPGVVIEIDCKCGHKLVWSGRDCCLYYPSANKKEYINMLCDKCEDEIEIPIKLNLSLELIK